MADTTRKNTKAAVRDGATRSSAETPVIGVERRGGVIPADTQGQPGNGEEPMTSAKPSGMPAVG